MSTNWNLNKDFKKKGIDNIHSLLVGGILHKSVHFSAAV